MSNQYKDLEKKAAEEDRRDYTLTARSNTGDDVSAARIAKHGRKDENTVEGKKKKEKDKELQSALKESTKIGQRIQALRDQADAYRELAEEYRAKAEKADKRAQDAIDDVHGAETVRDKLENNQITEEEAKAFLKKKGVDVKDDISIVAQLNEYIRLSEVTTAEAATEAQRLRDLAEEAEKRAAIREAAADALEERIEIIKDLPANEREAVENQILEAHDIDTTYEAVMEIDDPALAVRLLSNYDSEVDKAAENIAAENQLVQAPNGFG